MVCKECGNFVSFCSHLLRVEKTQFLFMIWMSYPCVQYEFIYTKLVLPSAFVPTSQVAEWLLRINSEGSKRNLVEYYGMA